MNFRKNFSIFVVVAGFVVVLVGLTGPALGACVVFPCTVQAGQDVSTSEQA